MWLKGEIMSSVKICMTVLLVINTWTDIRKKEICLPVLFIFLAGGILGFLTGILIGFSKKASYWISPFMKFAQE